MNSLKMTSPAVLVTGAGKGIGRAFVEEWIERSDRPKELRLLLVSRTIEDLESLQSHCEMKGVECRILACDLADQPGLPVETCLGHYSRIDALIHCAGAGRFGEFPELTREDLNHTIRTNVEATFLLLQKTFIAMKNQSLNDGIRGQIQVVTSVAAERPFRQSAAYCMSKYAQRGLIDSMREYCRESSIRLLEVRPGAVFTPMWGEVDATTRTRMMEPRGMVRPMVEALCLPSSVSLELLTLRPTGGDI